MAVELLFFIFKFIFFSFLITLPFLYDLNAKFRYYFKFSVFYILVAFASVLLLPLTGWKVLRGAKIMLASKFCSFIATVLNTKWKVIGVENLKLEKSCILANYQSPVDIIGMFEIWPHLDECIIVAENGVYSSPLTLAVSRCFFFDKFLNFVQRRSSEVAEVLQKNVNIWIFSKDMHELKNDIFRHVLEKHLSIVPVIISSYYFIDTRRKLFEPGNVTIELLPPVTTKNRSIDDASTIIRELGTKMTDEFTSLSKQTTPLTLKELRDCYVF